MFDFDLAGDWLGFKHCIRESGRFPPIKPKLTESKWNNIQATPSHPTRFCDHGKSPKLTTQAEFFGSEVGMIRTTLRKTKSQRIFIGVLLIEKLLFIIPFL